MGDATGNGYPVVAFTSSTRIMVVTLFDGRLLLEILPPGLGLVPFSNYTVGDTNADGVGEIVAIWGSAPDLLVIDAATGLNLSQFRIAAITAITLAVVDDVDGDGNGDIVLVGLGWSPSLPGFRVYSAGGSVLAGALLPFVATSVANAGDLNRDGVPELLCAPGLPMGVHVVSLVTGQVLASVRATTFPTSIGNHLRGASI